jgi:protein-disulfide isomerase-like protein with CxxC motif
MNDSNGHLWEDIVIQVNLKEHLTALEQAEYAKPINQRRQVPTIADLARALGINRTILYNWATQKYESTRHDILGVIINALSASGFPTTIEDLLKAHPASTVPAQRIEDGDE